MTRTEFLLAAVGLLLAPATALADAAPDEPEDAMGLFLRSTRGGAVVERVLPRSASERAGIRAGDVVLAIGDLSPSRMEQEQTRRYRRLGWGFAFDTDVRLRRGRQILTVQVRRRP